MATEIIVITRIGTGDKPYIMKYNATFFDMYASAGEAMAAASNRQGGRLLRWTQTIDGGGVERWTASVEV